MNLENHYAQAELMDRNDELAEFRSKFVIPKNTVYLDGNSLGMLPKKTIQSQENLVREQWGERLIRGWNEGWISMAGKTAIKIAELLGASPDEIFVGDTTSINLYKLAFAALQYKNKRNEILTDDLNFPTDIYVLEGLIKSHFSSHRLKFLKSLDGVTILNSDIEKKLNEKTALLSLSAVSYKSAFMYDMNEVNTLARANDTLVLWDLSHAAGAVPINLNASKTDLAVGCSYKYLNGGPGAPAFLYVSKKLQGKLNNPIWSWFSHEAPFNFDPKYKAANDIQKFAISTPSILGMDPIITGVNLLLDASMKKIREKSVAQTAFLIELIEEILEKYGVQIATPKNELMRGSHVAIQHKEAYRINAAMINPKVTSGIVIPDFRPPNNIRLGITPLYTSFVDIVKCVDRIATIIASGEYKRFSHKKPIVV